MAAATAVGTLSFPLSNFRLLQLEETPTPSSSSPSPSSSSPSPSPSISSPPSISSSISSWNLCNQVLINYRSKLSRKSQSPPGQFSQLNQEGAQQTSRRRLNAKPAHRHRRNHARTKPHAWHQQLSEPETRELAAHITNLSCAACQPRSKGPEFNNRVIIKFELS